MKLYLSGPMTGLPEFNYPAFREAAAILRGKGHAVYNPADWEEMNGGVAFNLLEAFIDYTDWIITEADAVVVLPGWENSPGATAETALARAIKKPVYRMPGLGETLLEMVDAEAQAAPECPNHQEVQKRDGKPPWCSWCGWRHSRPAVSGEKVGLSADEKAAQAKHLPWNPQTGYAIMTTPPLPQVQRPSTTTD